LVIPRLFFAFLDRWHWALLALAAPFLLFPSPTRSLALLVVPGLWLVAWLAGRKPLPRTPLNATLLVMFCMVLVSMWATYDLAFSLPKIAGMVLGIGVFFAVVREGERPIGWWLCLLVYLMAGLGIAGLGLFGTNWLAKFGFLMPITSRLPTRITGLPGAEAGFSGNELAGALVWVIPVYIVLAVLLFVRARDVRAAWGWWRTVVLTAVIGMATLFVTGLLGLTQSRGGYLGFGLAMIGLAFIVLSRRWRLLLGSAVIAAVILLVAVWRFQDDTVLHVLVNDSPALSPDSALGTWEGRSEVWSRAIYGIQDFPFTGMGMNTFRRVVHVLYPLFLVSPDVDIAHAHNEFLQAGLDLGIPGLIAFVALYIGAFWMLADIWRLTPTSNLQPSTPALSKVEGSNLQLHLTRALVLGFGGGLFAHIVYSMTDAVALGAKPGFLFWMLLALIVGLFYQVRASPPIFRSK
jgi:putative inorganic carbon (HCO3(-)) transporter